MKGLNVYNVKDFGAVGDGKTLDTQAFSQAITYASQTQGTVFVPNGVWLIGTIYLKSNIRFVMDENAVLKGSDKKEHYERYPQDENNAYLKRENGPYGTMPFCSLVCVDQAENVEITGGKIVFNDLAFNDKHPLNPIILDEEYIQGIQYIRQPSYYYHPKQHRPMAVYISRSENIVMKNVALEKCPVYSVWCLNSEKLIFEQVRIKNSKYQWNGDGLHFSACRHVHIADCNIDASDDCIAIDSNYGGQSYDFNVKNCLFKTTIHAIRLYTGLDLSMDESCNGDYERYSVSNIKISDCKVVEGAGILLICSFDGNIRDVQIENLECKQSYEGTAISMSAKAGTISGIQIKNCKFDCNGVGYYCAEKNGRIASVQLEKCQFSVTPKTKFWGDDFPDGLATHMFSMPYAMVCKNVEDLTLNEVYVHWNDAIFTNTYSEEYANKVKEAWGEQRLGEIEPKYIQTLQLTNSDIKTINCQLENYMCS